MPTKIISLTSCAVLGMLMAPLVSADEQKIRTIEHVLVSATRFEGPELPLATNITIIDSEDIRLSGATRVSELLRSQAGIQIRDFEGSGRNIEISMRGFGANAANNTLVIVDGHKLNNPSLAAPALNAISIKDIERIEIVRGSAGVLYGDQAVGGVINVVLKRSQPDSFTGDIEVGRGSDDLETVNGSLSQGFSNGLSYRVSAENKKTDNYRDNNELSYENVLANLRYDYTNGHLFAETQKINDDLNLPGPISEQQAREDRRQTNNPGDFSDQTTDLLRFGGKYEIADGLTFAAEYGWRDEDTEGVLLFDFEQSTRVKTFTPRIQKKFSAPGGDAVTTVGYDWVRSAHETIFSDSEQDLDALYAQLVYPVSQRLTASVGGRSSEVEDRNKNTSEKNDDRLEAYEAGISYQVVEAVRVFARYADAFRFANIDENGFVVPGTGFLSPQTSQSVELGAQWSIDSSEIKVSVFDMKLDDEIVYDAEVFNGSTFPGANVNLPSSRREGLLVEGSFWVAPRLSVRANFSYVDAEQESGSFEGKKVPFVASRTGNITLSYEINQGLTAFMEANYTGSRYKVDDDSNSESKVDAETIVNANVSWQHGSWLTNLRVKNLTGEEYSDYHAVWGLYPQARRTVEARVAYRF